MSDWRREFNWGRGNQHNYMPYINGEVYRRCGDRCCTYNPNVLTWPVANPRLVAENIVAGTEHTWEVEGE